MHLMMMVFIYFFRILGRWLRRKNGRGAIVVVVVVVDVAFLIPCFSFIEALCFFTA
jgi:predicted PurR-regulated permease PerM